MPDVKTDDKEPFTDGSEMSERELLVVLLSKLDLMGHRVDHIDEGVHALDRHMSEVTEFFAEHRGALARAASLLDGGSKLGGFITGRKPAKGAKE
jgi:hypothetical protein